MQKELQLVKMVYQIRAFVQLLMELQKIQIQMTVLLPIQ
jgi:hypothetical protein